MQLFVGILCIIIGSVWNNLDRKQKIQKWEEEIAKFRSREEEYKRRNSYYSEKWQKRRGGRGIKNDYTTNLERRRS